MSEIRHVRRESKEPRLLGRLLRVLEEQRGHTLAMDIENAKIALSGENQSDVALSWIEPGLNIPIGRADLVTHTEELAKNIGARIGICLRQARLDPDDINAVFLTGGSVQLAHVRRAILQGLPAAKVIEGDTFGAVGKGLTIEAARRFGPARATPEVPS
jgi:hypothetical chaperone protein